MQTGSNLRAFLEGEKAAFLLDFEDARKCLCAKRSASERAEAAVAHNNWPDSGSQLNAQGCASDAREALRAAHKKATYLRDQIAGIEFDLGQDDEFEDDYGLCV